MSHANVVRLYDPRDSLRTAFDVGYSSCSRGRCGVPVSSCSVGCPVSVSSNEVSVVVVFVKNTVKVLVFVSRKR